MSLPEELHSPAKKLPPVVWDEENGEETKNNLVNFHFDPLPHLSRLTKVSSKGVFANMKCIDGNPDPEAESVLPIKGFFGINEDPFAKTELLKHYVKTIDLMEKDLSLLMLLNLHHESKKFAQHVLNRFEVILKDMIKAELRPDQELVELSCFNSVSRSTSLLKGHAAPTAALHTDYQRFATHAETIEADRTFLGERGQKLLDHLTDDKVLRMINFWIPLNVSTNTLIFAMVRNPETTDSLTSFVTREDKEIYHHSFSKDDILNGSVELVGGIRSIGKGYVFDSKNQVHAGAQMQFPNSSRLHIFEDRESEEVRCGVVLTP